MKKIISVQGDKGTFTGTVEVRFNVTKTTIEVHNRSTHDEEKKAIPVHKVVGMYEDKVVSESIEILKQDEIPYHAGLVEKVLRQYLENLANGKSYAGNKPKPDVTNKLKSLGYE